MELSRLVSGGVPLIMNVALTSAATVRKGVILTMSVVSTTGQGAAVSATSTSAIGGAAIGVTQVSTAQASAAPENVNAMNAYRFNIDTDGIPNRSAVSGSDWIPTCINVDALYMASYGTSSAVNEAMTKSITASVGTIVTIASTSTTNKVGGWIMDGGNTALADGAGTPTFNGQLRYMSVVVAADSFGLLTAMNVSTDSNIVWCGPTMRKFFLLNDAGDLAGSMTATTTGKLASNLLIIEQYVQHDAAPLHPLRQWVDDGLNGLTGNVMFSEVAFAGHATTIAGATE